MKNSCQAPYIARMSKQAQTDHPVHELISKRWSPYGFSDRAVSDADLRSIFEAARWSASSFNEQPWSYIVARKDDPAEFDKLLSCLMEGNQGWARAAPVLVLSVAKRTFTHNDKPNRVAEHDIGLASGNICLEATARGLSVHQMAGILPDRAREVYGIPAGHDVVTGLAIGYAADPANLPETVRARDTALRQRKPLAEFVYSGGWGRSSPLG